MVAADTCAYPAVECQYANTGVAGPFARPVVACRCVSTGASVTSVDCARAPVSANITGDVLFAMSAKKLSAKADVNTTNSEVRAKFAKEAQFVSTTGGGRSASRAGVELFVLTESAALCVGNVEAGLCVCTTGFVLNVNSAELYAHRL